jgi:putative Mg2+ transporter-C (MgtC) family protein
MDYAQLLILAKVLLGLILGGVIGYERETADKPAGFRTHMLVTGAAALLVAISDTLVASFGAAHSGGFLQADPIRVVEAVVTGISFLGAGTIFRRSAEEQIEGLTTAASLLFSVSIGIAVALEQWTLAGGATVLAVFVLRGARWFAPSGQST